MSAFRRKFYSAYIRRLISSFEAAGLDHEQDADQPNPTHTQCATYSANEQAKEEVGLNRSFEQSLQHVAEHYPAERQL